MLYPTQIVTIHTFGTRMPASHIITAKLLAAVSTSDLKAAATCLTSYIDGSTTYSSVVEREAAVDAIVAAMKGFGDPGMIAASLGALSHVSLFCTEFSLPIVTIAKLAKPHENNILVVKAASRLLSDHICYGSGEVRLRSRPWVDRTDPPTSVCRAESSGRIRRASP
jgi:hypothetical protein